MSLQLLCILSKTGNCKLRSIHMLDMVWDAILLRVLLAAVAYIVTFNQDTRGQSYSSARVDMVSTQTLPFRFCACVLQLHLVASSEYSTEHAMLLH